MVQFEDDTITDDQADAMALARAFQAASVSGKENKTFLMQKSSFVSLGPFSYLPW